MAISIAKALTAYDATMAALSHMRLSSKASATVHHEALDAASGLLQEVAAVVGVEWNATARGNREVRDAIDRTLGTARTCCGALISCGRCGGEHGEHDDCPAPRPPKLVVVVEDGILEGVYYDRDPADLDVVAVDVDHARTPYIIAKDATVELLADLAVGARRPEIIKRAVELLAADRQHERIEVDEEGREIPDEDARS